jgi:hypothetical protein
MEREHLTDLRKILIRHFNEGELRTLCFDLRIDYDDLPGRGKKDKARELVTYLDRRGRISELLEVIEQQRPNLREGNRRSYIYRWRGWSIDVRILAALIGATAVIIAALINSINGPTPTPANTLFTYQVQVQDLETGETIKGAHVTIAVGGSIAPIDDVTDSGGLAIIPVDASRAGKLGRLTVKAPGYEETVRNINLTEDTLPKVVQLASAP